MFALNGLYHIIVLSSFHKYMNKKQKRPKRKIHEVDNNNDITFNAPFSYRHLRILGWSFFAIAQIGIIMGLFSKINKITELSTASSILNLFGSLMMPLFLIAAFAQVLTAKNGYKRLILTYVGGAIGIYLAFLIVFYHFLVGFASVFFDFGTSQQTIESIVQALSENGFLAFNIFVDLALCTLLTFFLNYQPTKFFQGNKIMIFRSFAALPIIYEVTCIILKVLATIKAITLSPFLFPLLPTKPPVAFIIFIALAIFVKLRERHFIKNGKSFEEYQAFLDTNTNRKHLSRFLIVAIIIAVIIDVILFFVGVVALYAQLAPVEGEELEAIGATIQKVNSWGLGCCFPMLFIIPIIAFFDYRKTYNDSFTDIIIPVVGVALVVIIYIEGLFQFAKYALSDLIGAADDKPDTSNAALRNIKHVIDILRKK